MTRDAASERQVQAADPAASTWLSANAGSGKTRVLTDRVARLLLSGVEPQRILCLTYTKAAASEMQNRLFRRLGSWAMMDAARLSEELVALGIEANQIGPGALAAARRLFARAIETPGGLRIQTIHSFCASLLRRFPLEAGVSPQFTEMDDRAAKILRADIVEEMSDHIAPGAVMDIARLFNGESLDELTSEVARSRGGLVPPLAKADALHSFGLPETACIETIFRDVILGDEPAWLPSAISVMGAGSSSDVKLAQILAGLNLEHPNHPALAHLEDALLFGKTAKEPFAAKIGVLPTKATRMALGGLLDSLEGLMGRVEAARSRRLALLAAERTAALHGFAAVFLPEYERRKSARGWLDFDDLIDRAHRLLTDPSVAQWVLFRLDGGIDHILVDEAQDTSPDQWRVIELLTQEFTAGQGARDIERTIFVVGDKKQSIYSFQGADLAVFDRMKAHFSARLAEVDTHLADLTLEHSFRSSPVLLRLVDHTFEGALGVDLGGDVKHIASRDTMPGRVELWPAIAPVKDPEPEHWYDPTDLVSNEHHSAQLANRIADEIRRIALEGIPIPTQKGLRPATAGDVLILVQRRSTLFAEIIRACKAAGLPVAGADRLKLGAELAVKDLVALLSFLTTPEDDLSLAAVLRSPLFGWTEGQLFSLAQGRFSYLWTALRDQAETHPETMRILRDLRDQADYLRPYDLIERALTRHGGRQRLLARLGDEAEDGIDELLSQALAYERSEVPSLTGFLGWLAADDLQVKRQMGESGGRIRVMTVHGAKGLEAPIVILPETQDRRAPDGSEIVTLADGTAVWRTSTDESPPAMIETMRIRREKAAAESLRLLYVAMTRAQSWLIVAAAGKTESEACWYNIIRAGMGRSGAIEGEDGVLRLGHETWPESADLATLAPSADIVMPNWALTSPAQIERPSPPLSPSDLGGAKVMPGDTDPALEAGARRRGTELHLLLEHLPLWPDHERAALAMTLMADSPDTASLRLAEADLVLSHPDLAHVFAAAALAEVPIAGKIGGRLFTGTIDRLIATDERILAIDYKSNRLIPPVAEHTPEGILRQMGAYSALLEQVYPDRPVEVAILWTGGPVLMPLPRALVMAALQRAGFP
ncbi:MAG: double-strand break repair helicase AddA [Cereibacter sphaeroides]|uniref:DNA 3'-5' helicase n=1 Tax=Cereibacter sphaeroides TaxID=1063 RepID=A0A2W5S9Q6_CERSP|nr:MAG: double-strand break repair helicase AddA [Cereibacter sphaeroides]